MIPRATVVSTVENESCSSGFNIQINENNGSCDGEFYVSIRLGHGVPRHTVQQYSECVCEGALGEIKI